jgi:predicted N-formylglutamate amidohydrolase
VPRDRATPVARRLSRLIDASLVLQRYSRLAYDCSRPPDSPDAMPKISEITHIPGNRNLTPADRLTRIHRIYGSFTRPLSSSATAARRKASDPCW